MRISLTLALLLACGASARSAAGGISLRPARGSAAALASLRGGASEPSDAMLQGNWLPGQSIAPAARGPLPSALSRLAWAV